MASAREQAGYGRIEDFIALAKDGSKVHAGVDLRKQLVSEKTRPEQGQDASGELDMYLLSALFAFRVGGKEWRVRKVYMVGAAREFSHERTIDRQIANARLKVDYKRLKDANIVCDEAFF